MEYSKYQPDVDSVKSAKGFVPDVKTRYKI